MDDVPQRGDVVFVAHRFRQLHQPDEHGRHHEDGVDPLVLDQPEKFLGIEPRHQHQRAAETAGAQAERVRRGMVQRARQQRPRARLQAVDHRPHAFRIGALRRRRGVAPDTLGVTRRARGVDHVLRLRQRRAVIGRLRLQPGFEIGGEIGRREMRRIDLVIRQDFRRRRHAEHGDAGGNRVAQLMQHVGMADQDRRSGIPEDVIDFLRLEMPVDRHGVGAEPHRGIGRLDEGEVVAHEDADAVALPDAELAQSAGDAVGAIGDIGMTAASVAADDAEEGLGCFDHFVLLAKVCEPLS